MIQGAFYAVIEREFRRFFRRRGQLVSTLARPLLWLVVIGAGFAALVPERNGVGYREYLLPGIFGMVILFSTFLSSLGTVHDREFGPMRMLLIAPVPRAAVVGAKTLASALLAGAQAFVFLALVPAFGLGPSDGDLLKLVGSLFLTALALASVGMLVASVIRSLENFAVAMNFVIFPMFFLSGALYPVTSLPGYLEPFARVNPLTYGVDLFRHYLFSGTGLAEFSVTTDVVVLLGFCVYALAIAAALFGREEHLGLILLTGAPRRRKLADWLARLGLGGVKATPAVAAGPADLDERFAELQTRLDVIGAEVHELKELLQLALRRDLAEDPRDRVI